MEWMPIGLSLGNRLNLKMMNYFEFYEIPVNFKVDATALRTKFYALSKKYHPDFFTLADDEEQAEALRLSTLNNEAYKVLNDFDKRMKYILKEKEILGEEGKNKIPQDFLMEMMEINEPLMELQFDFDQKVFDSTHEKLKTIQDTLYNSIEKIVETYDESTAPTSDLETVKSYYLKKRYLLRIQENLDKLNPV